MNLKPVSYVLRIGHRPERDQRVTTHVGLSSRAHYGGTDLAEADAVSPSPTMQRNAVGRLLNGKCRRLEV